MSSRLLDVADVRLVAPWRSDSVGTLRPASLTSFLEDRGIRVERFDSAFGVDGARAKLGLLRHLLATPKGTAVVVSGGPFWPLPIVPLLRARRLVVVTDWRDPWVRLLGDTSSPRTRAAWAIETIALRSSSEVWVVNAAMRDAYLSVASPQRVRVVRNGHGKTTDEVLALANRASGRIPGRAIYTGTMHAIAPEEIERGAIRLRKLYPQLSELLIAGRCADHEIDTVRSALPGVEITLAGQVPYAELHDHIAAAEVGWVLLRTATEHVPTKCYDYVAAGVPMVFSTAESVAQELFAPFALVEPGVIPEIDLADRHELSRENQLRLGLVGPDDS